MLLRIVSVLNQKGIAQKTCADYLRISEKSWFNKTRGLTDFTYKEARALKQLFPEFDIDYLLGRTDDQGA